MNKLNDLFPVLGQFASAEAIPSAHLVRLFKETIRVAGMKIDALADVSRYAEGVVRVIYFVSEQRHGSTPNVCLMIMKDGSMFYELSTSLDAFWPILFLKENTSFTPAIGIVEEIRHFLENGKPRTPALHELRDGMANERMHRFMRSDQKCKELEHLFGYRLIAAEG